MNILLVRPRPHKETINLQSFMICEPLELEMLSSALEKEGHKTIIADMLLEKGGIENFLNSDIHMICFTSYIVHTGIVLEYAKAVKSFNKNIITAVGGVHAEVVPSDFLSTDVDYIVCRKPLKTIINIADGKVEDIKGCVYFKGGELLPVVTDTNPVFPDRTKTAKYRKHYNYVLHSRCASIKTSFGCPYSCEFCFCREITGGQYSCRKLPEVFEELKQIEENNVFIVDDNFLRSAEFINDFCNGLIQNGINKNYILFGRADFISNNRDAIAKLKTVGLRAVFVGIESFKKSELDSMEKRTSVEMNIKAVRVLEEFGVESYMGLICRHDWTKEDFDNLIEYLNGFKYPFINLQPITPIPGTKLYEAEKDNLELNRNSFHLWDMAHLSRPPENMTIAEFYKNMVRVYLKTAASKRVRKYIRKTYGLKVYLRTLKGAISIKKQYKALIRKNKINI